MLRHHTVLPTVYEARQGDLRLRIVIDEHAENPRKFSNLGTMVCWHRRYNLGDQHDFKTPDEFLRFTKRNRVLMLPLYLLDHSGVELRTTPFNDPWDSGQVGWIYVTYDKIRKELGVTRITQHIKEKIRKLLEAEVEEYGHYLSGRVYGFILEREVKHRNDDSVQYEIVDSCYGFYGEDWKANGLVEQLGMDYVGLIRQLN